jgi:hypothetical protein
VDEVPEQGGVMGYCMKHRGYDDKLSECPICIQEIKSKALETRLFILSLSDSFRELFVDTLNLCPYCWESDRGCQCWNDE